MSCCIIGLFVLLEFNILQLFTLRNTPPYSVGPVIPVSMQHDPWRLLYYCREVHVNTSHYFQESQEIEDAQSLRLLHKSFLLQE